jgi:ribosomal protein S18 acetylase RimI-like enzyme
MTIKYEINSETGNSEPVADIHYDLSDAEVHNLTKQLLAEYKTAIPKDMPFVCFNIRGTDLYSNLARTIEGRVFTEELCDEPDRMAADFKDYENYSEFFLVIDVNSEMPAGTLRIIENSNAGFMTVNELMYHVNPGDESPQNYSYEQFYKSANEQASQLGNTIDGIKDENTWEVGTIAVLKNYRRSRNSSEDQKIASYVVSGLLYRSLYAQACRRDIEGFVSMIDSTALGTLKSLGIPFEDLPYTKKIYFEDGSSFHPCFAVVPDFDVRMRSYADREYKNAVSEKEKAAAQSKIGLIDELLTGRLLDGMMVKT